MKLIAVKNKIDRNISIILIILSLVFLVLSGFVPYLIIISLFIFPLGIVRLINYLSTSYNALYYNDNNEFVLNNDITLAFNNVHAVTSKPVSSKLKDHSWGKLIIKTEEKVYVLHGIKDCLKVEEIINGLISGYKFNN